MRKGRRLNIAAAVSELKEGLSTAAPPRGSQTADLAFKGISEREAWGVDLVRHGVVGPNERSTLGMTPLFAACYALWLPGVKALLALGADPVDCGLNGGNAAQAAFIAAVDRHERMTLQATFSTCADILQELWQQGVALAYVRASEAGTVLAQLSAAAAEKGYNDLVTQFVNMTMT
jgi:hypothetical protein